jgi:predicted amidohydrolase
VSVLELPASWGEPQRMLDAVERAIVEGPATDLVVLPEASLAGYVSPSGIFDPSAFAETAHGATMKRVAEIARAGSAYIVAPLVLSEGDRLFNAAAVVSPAGETVALYRKRHPWFPETWATAGAEGHPVFRIGELSATFAICYDAHFLADEAAEELGAVDLLLFPSAWVDESDSRLPLLASLARRFEVAVANANWGPGVVRIGGQGGSFILDSRGEILAQVASGGSRADAVVSVQ